MSLKISGSKISGYVEIPKINIFLGIKEPLVLRRETVHKTGWTLWQRYSLSGGDFLPSQPRNKSRLSLQMSIQFAEGHKIKHTPTTCMLEFAKAKVFLSIQGSWN